MPEPEAPYSYTDFVDAVNVVVAQIQGSEFVPDIIAALATGGFTAAAVLAKKLKVPSHRVIGLPVFNASGQYSVPSNLVVWTRLTGANVLVVDDCTVRGILTSELTQELKQQGCDARSVALYSWREGIQPDYVAKVLYLKPGKFFWETS